jgi:hypothetical protein
MSTSSPPYNNSQVSRKSINPYAFACGVSFIIFFTKISSYLTPYKLYFSFSSFLYSNREIFRWESLTIKLFVPCLVGFLLFYIPFQWMKFTRGSSINHRSIYRYLRFQSDLTANAAGFFSALLMAWPFIVYWDVLMQPDMQHLKPTFLFIYFLYFMSYSYFSGLGVNLARLALRRYLPMRQINGVTERVAWLETIRTSVLGIITSSIATYVASLLGSSV